MQPQKQTILVIEDEVSIRSMVRFTLIKSNYDVLEAGDTKQAQNIIAKRLPDLILLDWMLPQQSGISYTKKLKNNEKTRDIPIIMLTAKVEEENKVLGLDSGVDDYVVKPFSPRELVSRIKAVLRRGPIKQPDDTLIVRDLEIDTRSQRVTIKGEALKLGPLEYRLLAFMMAHQDRVYSRNNLLTHVWGNDAYVDERTVDVHIRRVRKQLEKFQYHTLIQTVHGAGYRFSEKYDECKV
ncbi:MAG: phosphate regulon transcriptional regulator PhoB [Gammaproteobacteria bacterium]|nr:phosphate regulon transcriptional regulator PhoB [Gammaproteobacteria bacterium]